MVSDARERSAPYIRPSVYADGLLGLAFCLVYLSTCLPSVLPADNGEFQLVTWKLGIAHPPGYALYTIVGWLFTRFFTSPAFALNLLSAILAAITLVIVSRAVRALTQSTRAGVLAAALLGTSTTFWAQATTANIRMPTALFTALCVSLLVAWSRRRAVDQSPRPLVIFSFVLSLGLGHHLSLAFPALFFILFILLNDRALIKQPRRWIAPLIVLALGLSVLVYLPLRGATGGTLADGEATTYLAQPDKLLDYVLGRGFEGDFFYFINTRPDLLLDRVALLPTLFNFQFNWLVFGLFLIGAIRLIRREWKLAVMLIGGMALHTFVALTYRAPQTVEYLLPAYVLMAIVVGAGLGVVRSQKSAVSRTLDYAGGWLLNSLAGLAIVALFITHFPSFQWLRANDDTRAYTEALLDAAPPNAILLSNWHWATPLWYLQQVEGQRPDVEVEYVFPRDEPLAQSWLKRIAAHLPTGRPVIVDMFFRDAFNASPYFFTPLSTNAWQVCAAACDVSLAAFVPQDINFENKFRLIGRQLLTPAAPAGEPLTLLVAYRVDAPPDPVTAFFAHLVNPDGRVIGQADQIVPTGRYQVGAVFTQRFAVTPLVSVPPGEYQLLAGAYTSAPLTAAGNERVPIATARVTAPDRLIDPGGLYLSSGVVYVASSASGGEAQPGAEVTLNLNFIATRPILRDYVVSVQMTGAGWRVTDDSVPALGALPTLKWLAGSLITDRHALIIPADAAPGPATISVIVYDAFTQEPLALLDAELIKRGQSIPIGTWDVVAR